MSAPPSLPADEIQRLRHEIQQLRVDLQNAVQQASAHFDINIQNVQTDVQKLRSDVHPDLMKTINGTRGFGNIMPYRIVPFKNGDDPTQPPYNLPHLLSCAVIEQLSEQQLISYLTGYGVEPLPTPENPRKTVRFWRNTLTYTIGGSGGWSCYHGLSDSEEAKEAEGLYQ